MDGYFPKYITLTIEISKLYPFILGLMLFSTTQRGIII